jgi:hypothetical protein
MEGVTVWIEKDEEDYCGRSRQEEDLESSILGYY